MTKREQTDQAKKLLEIEKKPNEALAIYQQVWNNFKEERNEWDAVYSLKSIRAAKEKHEQWEKEVMEAYPESIKVKGLYKWILFDRFIKPFKSLKIDIAEKGIRQIVETYEQQNFNVEEPSTFPCPYTIGVFKLLKAYKKPNFNTNKIGLWISKLDPDKLSRQFQTMQVDGKTKELASDFEEYYAVLTKYLLEIKDYQKCIEICEKGLLEIDNFHYDNDIWFQRRKALSLLKQGKSEEAELLFEQLLEKKAGQKWFIEKELSEIYVEEKEFEKALLHAAKAAMMGQDIDKKAGLYYTLSRVFAWLKRTEEGKIHAELVLAVSKKFDLKLKPDYEKMFKYFNVEVDHPKNPRTLIRTCEKIWEKVVFADKEQYQGEIIKVHNNGKSGNIKRQDGQTFFFSMREITNHRRHEEIEGALVNFYLKPATDRDGNPTSHGENITITKRPTPIHQDSNFKKGDQFPAIVDGIAPYGIFVQFNETKGLVHRSKTSIGAEESLEQHFRRGMKVRVEFIGFHKGKPSFRLVE